MSELISGKEALIALANGNQVLYINPDYQHINTWGYASDLEVREFGSGKWIFKLKPRTIKINGVEVPAPFKPKDGDEAWHIYPRNESGYGYCNADGEDDHYFQFGAWRTEEEIKQVVAALRSVFNENN